MNEQLITENYSIYNNDCMYILPQIPNQSIDLSIYSPPFAGLYNYSSSDNDFSNCENKEQFLEQYEFLVKEISRVTKPGRITAVHTQDILMNVTKHYLWDFPHEIIKLHLENGFHYVNKITVWKEPLKVRMRTMVRSLMHKLVVEDSSEVFTAIPDYVLIFKKVEENKVPITHELGLSEYHGGSPMTESLKEQYGDWDLFKKKWKDCKNPKINKLSHIIWQRYASSVWDDIRSDNVLQFKSAREDEDEKHVHPLQLDIIQRLVELYSNKDEIILTPFMGVGSEVYGAVNLGRKSIGIELKQSYYKQAVRNLESIKTDKIKKDSEIELFDVD